MLRPDPRGTVIRRRPPLVAIALVLSACVSGALDGAGGSSVPDPTPTPRGSEVPPTVAPSVSAGSSPSATADPTPTASPDAALLALDLTSCEGGVVLHWTASLHPAFHHYIALRSPEREIAPHYPPIAPAVDWGDTYATDRFVTSGIDASIIPSATRWFYRVMAYDVDGVVVSASNVASGQLHPVEDLGPLEVGPADDGGTRIGWRSYGGFSECFSQYRVLYGMSGSTPSTLLAVVSDQSVAEIETDALRAGSGYAFRVQAVRTTTLGSFVVAESEIGAYLVP